MCSRVCVTPYNDERRLRDEMRFYSETMTLLHAALPNRWHRWGLLTLFWLLMATLSSLHWEVFFFGQNPYDWWQLFRVKIALWWVWGAVTPVILWFGWKFRFDKGRMVRSALVLFPASIAATALYMLIYASMVFVNAGHVDDLGLSTFGQLFNWVVGVHSSWYFLAFWATIAIENTAIYHRNYRDRELLTSQLEGRLAVAQLDALRNQLQPHFLFNTLHSILSLVRQKDHDTATQMLTALSDLLRHALEHVQRQQVPLREELQFLQRYIDIEQVRFSDRLTVNWDIEDDTLNAFVPPFVLQPLAENAIRHGIEKRPGRGQIDISTHRDNGSLCLDIRDNGVGVSNEPSRGSTHGHGLGDMRARLDVMYPNEYSLTVESEAEVGTHVRLTLPWTQSESFTATPGETHE